MPRYPLIASNRYLKDRSLIYVQWLVPFLPFNLLRSTCTTIKRIIWKKSKFKLWNCHLNSCPVPLLFPPIVNRSFNGPKCCLSRVSFQHWGPSRSIHPRGLIWNEWSLISSFTSGYESHWKSSLTQKIVTRQHLFGNNNECCWRSGQDALSPNTQLIIIFRLSAATTTYFSSFWLPSTLQSLQPTHLNRRAVIQSYRLEWEASVLIVSLTRSVGGGGGGWRSHLKWV